MFALLFNIGDQRYALDSFLVEEIIPLVALREIPHTPEYVAGILNYRGRVAPVVDLCALVTEKPCSVAMGTRIILTRYERVGRETEILGLIAENVMEVIELPEEYLRPAGIESKDAEYLAEVDSGDKEMIQVISLERLLPESLHESLFNR